MADSMVSTKVSLGIPLSLPTCSSTELRLINIDFTPSCAVFLFLGGMSPYSIFSIRRGVPGSRDRIQEMENTFLATDSWLLAPFFSSVPTSNLLLNSPDPLPCGGFDNWIPPPPSAPLPLLRPLRFP